MNLLRRGTGCSLGGDRVFIFIAQVWKTGLERTSDPREGQSKDFGLQPVWPLIPAPTACTVCSPGKCKQEDLTEKKGHGDLGTVSRKFITAPNSCAV